MILATINSVDNVNGLKVQVDGENSPTTKKYSYLASYVPTAGDRVLIEEIGGSYVILGKIITEVTQSGIARQATTAETCTGNAATATVASSCIGNAATATVASSCSGNAATSTISDKTKGFDTTTVPYSTGSLVTSVSRNWNSVINQYVVSDVTITMAGNFPKTS